MLIIFAHNGAQSIRIMEIRADSNSAMASAATRGINIVRMCHEWGAADVNRAMVTAAGVDIVPLSEHPARGIRWAGKIESRVSI